MSDITLSKAVRSNLLSLQNTADLMATTQNRLATGKKVNSALDNPTNFFTASSLNARAGDMNQLLDGMANGIQTLEAADNGLTAITKTLESMQSTLRQARQDKSFHTETFSIDSSVTEGSLKFSAGALGDSEIEINLVSDVNSAAPASTQTEANDLTLDTTFVEDLGFAEDDAIEIGDVTFTVEDGDTIGDLISAINDEDAGVEGVTASLDGGRLVLTADDNETAIPTINIDTTEGDLAGLEGQAAPDEVFAVKSVDDLVREINNDSDLRGNIRASNDNGNLRIENLSTQSLSVGGVSSTGIIDGQSDVREDVIAGNSVRDGLAEQYNELRDQLDKLADDASFNGVNLLRGDNLQITFNETGTSEINIRTEDENGINSAFLKIQTSLNGAQLDDDSDIDGFLNEIKDAINTVRSQASAFGSNLSVVENRQAFTKNMINTLETGAANLTLADSNEEAANLLALQTRQQLSSTALSMASQQDQSVLRLF